MPAAVSASGYLPRRILLIYFKTAARDGAMPPNMLRFLEPCGTRNVPDGRRRIHEQQTAEPDTLFPL